MIKTELNVKVPCFTRNVKTFSQFYSAITIPILMKFRTCIAIVVILVESRILKFPKVLIMETGN